MKKTKIDWCDATWNPVTGCLHGCTYCYAGRIANRFSGHAPTENLDDYCKWPPEDGRLDCGDCQKCNHVLNEPFRCSSTYEYMQIASINTGKIEPYPYGFNPTFHRYRLDVPQRWKKPRNIFVCSMADLFGDWVPDEWIQEVFKACEKAPQHRYLFLTKNPKRYDGLWRLRLPYLYGAMFGYSIDGAMPESRWEENDPPAAMDTFVSVEPLIRPLHTGDLRMIQLGGWAIVGAETGNRKGKIVPEKKWVMDIANACAEAKTPVFMKESLRDLMGDDFRQEFPWEEK